MSVKSQTMAMTSAKSQTIADDDIDINKVNSKNVITNNQPQDQRTCNDDDKKSSENIHVMFTTMTNTSTKDMLKNLPKLVKGLTMQSAKQDYILPKNFEYMLFKRCLI